QPKEQPKPVKVNLDKDLTMEFVLIQKGKFTMGSPADEKLRGNDEEQHEVEITQSFYLAKYLVTQEQYQALMRTNPSWFSEEGSGRVQVKEQGLDTRQFPVERVAWNDATTFCKKMQDNDKQGRKFRLPTEAEWEYACRAGTKTPFHFGAIAN